MTFRAKFTDPSHLGLDHARAWRGGPGSSIRHCHCRSSRSLLIKFSSTVFLNVFSPSVVCRLETCQTSLSEIVFSCCPPLMTPPGLAVGSPDPLRSHSHRLRSPPHLRSSRSRSSSTSPTPLNNNNNNNSPPALTLTLNPPPPLTLYPHTPPSPSPPTLTLTSPSLPTLTHPHPHS